MAEPATLTFRVNGKDYPVPTTFTVGEMCDAERYFGVEFGEAATTSMRMAAAMLWIAIRREDPTVTVDDIRNLPPDVFSALGEEGPRPPETPEPNANNGSSGDGSEAVSDLLVVDQSPSGAQG
jgi:hypothetical protein